MKIILYKHSILLLFENNVIMESFINSILSSKYSFHEKSIKRHVTHLIFTKNFSPLNNASFFLLVLDKRKTLCKLSEKRLTSTVNYFFILHFRYKSKGVNCHFSQLQGRLLNLSSRQLKFISHTKHLHSTIYGCLHFTI